ncbi:MAG: NGG1p interacting factor NIF3, partial [Bacteroidota bacterium]
MKSSSSRRTFLQTTGMGLLGANFLPLELPAQAPAFLNPPTVSMTIQEAIDAIMARIPGERRANSVDTIKSSSGEQRLRGIVTTFLATVPVIQQTIAIGANLIITHEPTYYQHL